MKTLSRIVIVLALAPVTFGQIEPGAGTWKTWVLPSSTTISVPPPPDAQETRGERAHIKELIDQASKDVTMMAQIKFWDSGSPGYRWLEVVTKKSIAGTTGPQGPRVYLYTTQAVYDATIAVWNYKYQYKRDRPSLVKGAARANIRFDALLPVPDSPSYPSEHSAIAAAAAEVLAALYPAEASTFRAMAEEAGQSRVNAGLQYPSDHEAGAELGRKIGLAVVAWASSDGSTTPFTTPAPTGKCNWVGTNPGGVAAIYWRPVLMTSASEFRPPAPPACDSPQMVQQTADVKNTPRALTNFKTNERAFYWQSAEGRDTWGYRYANQWMEEDHLNLNPPRAARVYALMAGAFYDSFIASQDGKIAYWYIRPPQLDPSIVPLFPVPNFPSYPSNHSTLSTALGEVLAYFFPSRAAQARTMAKESGDSRIWAGIHYQIDNEAGVELGKKVAGKFIDWAQDDGSQ